MDCVVRTYYQNGISDLSFEELALFFFWGGGGGGVACYYEVFFKHIISNFNNVHVLHFGRNGYLYTNAAHKFNRIIVTYLALSVISHKMRCTSERNLPHRPRCIIT